MKLLGQLFALAACLGAAGVMLWVLVMLSPFLLALGGLAFLASAFAKK